MKTILLLLLFTSSLFSQKLWEIEVDPSDYLRDVVEIPNSDLLLFTYNTGKLEIRNSQDGSFVNQLISKPNESGDLKISSSGKAYYMQNYNLYNNGFENDSIEIRDITNNEVIFKISISIAEFEGNPNFNKKIYSRLELFDNDSKLLCYFIYKDTEDNRNSINNFIIYNLLTNEIEHISKPFTNKLTTISKSYLSPDDKYFIETAYGKPYARMFNLETREYEYEFDGENNEEQKTKVGILENGKFQNDNLITDSYADIFVLYSFPTLTLIDKIDVWSKAGFLIGAMVEMNVCDNIFITDVSIRKENSTTQYNYYFVKYNFKNNEILYSSFNEQDSYQYRPVFSFDNCEKVLVNRDINNIRNGIIVCYDSSVLNIEDEIEIHDYFSKKDNSVDFNSQKFLGQTARIEIFNSIGANVGTLYNGIISQQNYTFQIPELPNGTYYLQCQLPNQNLNFNFVVVR